MGAVGAAVAAVAAAAPVFNTAITAAQVVRMRYCITMRGAWRAPVISPIFSQMRSAIRR